MGDGGGNACPTCGDGFDTDHGMKVHHVAAHGESLAKETIECSRCGETFEDYQSNNRGYCSAECAYEDGHVPSGEDHPQHSRTELECDWCGSAISRTSSETYDHNFCDKECQFKWYSGHISGESHPHWRGTTELECIQCSDAFERPKHQEQRAKFCSRGCKGEWMSEHQIQEDHPNWKGGVRTYYGANWESQRERARDRDDHACQGCGISSEELGFEPHVHHVIPFREFNDYEEANTLDNLVCLCPTCHSKWEGVPIAPQLID